MLPFTNRLNAYFIEENAKVNQPIEHVVDIIQNVNNYLFIIQGYIEILLSRELTLEEQHKYLLIIHEESDELNHILNGYCKST
jgi:signal transduction histidine kinase